MKSGSAQRLQLSASCMCTSVLMLRAGRIVCATCDAPLIASQREVGTYSTATPASYPPGCKSRRGARDRIRAVPDHVRSGDGRATIWSVEGETYRIHYARRSLAKAPALKLVPAPVQESDEAAVEAALAAAGTRATKRAA